jgi:N-acetylglucosamine kinase-like BadF-type ATPase
MSAPLVLGVDGGGTKTVAWLAPLADDGSGRVLGRGNAGPGNPRAVGFETAQANIEAAIAAAFADAELTRTPVAAACFGLAGAGRPAEQQQIQQWALGCGIAATVQVTDDAEPILAAASLEGCGIALIAGTGSLCLGRNAAGETARCGGWGYLLGDEGSGYAIALAGLRAAVRAADGRGPPTDLLPAFLQRLGAASPQELIGRVYAPEMTRERVAALASVVFDYRSTDDVARTIVDRAASDLAEMAQAVAKKLDLPPRGYTLAVAGGTLLGQLDYFQEAFSKIAQSLQGAAMLPSRWVNVDQPVVGAVALARRL